MPSWPMRRWTRDEGGGVAIPLAVSLLIMIHFWRVRKDGGISGPM